jgi:glutaconate CoA-transferase subunit A
MSGDLISKKLISVREMAATLKDGDHVAFGGGGLLRKPMFAAVEVARSTVSSLHVSSFFAGPEVDLLIGVDKITTLSYAFVGFDVLGMAPNFRRVRETGKIQAKEYSEWMFLLALQAAASKVPFMPTRSGLGADLLHLPDSPFREFHCPISGQPLVAVPALVPDVAFIHANEVDLEGNLQIWGDAFADVLLTRAATTVYALADRVVPSLTNVEKYPTFQISRVWISAVAVVPDSTGFTGAPPSRAIDFEGVADYQRNATSSKWLAHFVDGFGSAL